MELIHVVSGIDAILGPKGAEHFDRHFEVYNVDRFVARLPEFAPRHLHDKRIPLARIGVSEYRCDEIILKRKIRHRSVCAYALIDKVLFCHFFAFSHSSFVKSKACPVRTSPRSLTSMPSVVW